MQVGNLNFDKDKLGFAIEDVNFDGYKVIRIENSLGQNVYNNILLWDQKSRQFVFNREFSSILSAFSVDNENKILIYVGRWGGGLF